MESPSSSPGKPHPMFYSDGRPRPPSDDDVSSVSIDGCGNASVTPVANADQFVDPNQPKLLLAEESIQPSENKAILGDEFGRECTPCD